MKPYTMAELHTQRINGEKLGLDMSQIELEIAARLSGTTTEEVNMGFTKHGTGEIIPEEGDDQRTASQNFTDQDRKELAEELADEDSSE